MTIKDPIKREARRIKKNAATAARYAANKEIFPMYHQLLHLSRKDDPEYMKHRCETVKTYQQNNPDRMRAQAKKSKAKHAEKRAAEVREWFAANPGKRVEYQQNRRAKKKAAGGSLSVGLKERLFKMQKGKCPCCQLPLGNDAHMDHIVPLSMGGSNTDENMQLLRAVCNMQKSAKHPVDFMQSRGFLL